MVEVHARVLKAYIYSKMIEAQASVWEELHVRESMIKKKSICCWLRMSIRTLNTFTPILNQGINVTILWGFKLEGVIVNDV